MEDTDYDEASRHLAKQARGLMMHWLLELDDTHVGFGSFVDSVLRRIAARRRRTRSRYWCGVTPVTL